MTALRAAAHVPTGLAWAAGALGWAFILALVVALTCLIRGPRARHATEGAEPEVEEVLARPAVVDRTRRPDDIDGTAFL